MSPHYSSPSNGLMVMAVIINLHALRLTAASPIIAINLTCWQRGEVPKRLLHNLFIMSVFLLVSPTVQVFKVQLDNVCIRVTKNYSFRKLQGLAPSLLEYVV